MNDTPMHLIRQHRSAVIAAFSLVVLMIALIAPSGLEPLTNLSLSSYYQQFGLSQASRVPVVPGAVATQELTLMHTLLRGREARAGRAARAARARAAAARARLAALARSQSVFAPAPTAAPTTAPPPSPVTSGSVNWYAIAACESGGNWSTNTGNGFWGGLQFTPSTWFANGGGPFNGVGPFPYSAAQQIAVAERVLASQGIGAWPVCGARG